MQQCMGLMSKWAAGCLSGGGLSAGRGVALASGNGFDGLHAGAVMQSALLALDASRAPQLQQPGTLEFA